MMTAVVFTSTMSVSNRVIKKDYTLDKPSLVV